MIRHEKKCNFYHTSSMRIKLLHFLAEVYERNCLLFFGHIYDLWSCNWLMFLGHIYDLWSRNCLLFFGHIYDSRPHNCLLFLGHIYDLRSHNCLLFLGHIYDLRSRKYLTVGWAGRCVRKWSSINRPNPVSRRSVAPAAIKVDKGHFYCHTTLLPVLFLAQNGFFIGTQ